MITAFARASLWLSWLERRFRVCDLRNDTGSSPVRFHIQSNNSSHRPIAYYVGGKNKKKKSQNFLTKFIFGPLQPQGGCQIKQPRIRTNYVILQYNQFREKRRRASKEENPSSISSVIQTLRHSLAQTHQYILQMCISVD